MLVELNSDSRTARGRIFTMGRLLRAVRHPIGSMKLLASLAGSKKRCYVCQNTFRAFLPYRGGLASVSSFCVDMRVIGSDVDNFSCPYCKSFDRERHLLMYFDKLQFWDRIKNASVLHFAPELHLAKRIASLKPLLYVKGDLLNSAPDMETIDATAIPYPNNSFDLLICNHVLEHVHEDRLALSEFCRVLKPGGHAILQTPYSNVLDCSFSSPAINTDELRSRYYGQEDHVRLYGRDLFARIAEAGLRLQVAKHEQCLSEFDHSYYGVNRAEDLLLAVKPL